MNPQVIYEGREFIMVCVIGWQETIKAIKYQLEKLNHLHESFLKLGLIYNLYYATIYEIIFIINGILGYRFDNRRLVSYL